MPFITANERQRRIIQLSQAWDVTLPVVPSQPPSSKQQRPPSHRKPGDDQVAEDLLRRRAVEIAQSRPKSLGHAFSLSNLKKGKGWEPAAIVEVLRNWIAQDGSAGVVEALIAQLEATGVDMGTGAVQKPGKLSRRRSTETPLDRTQLVRLAVERNQPDVVQVLLPHADHLTLDACLPVAIRGGNIQIVDMLLSYGGSVSRNDEAQMAFRQACAVQSQADLVGRILQSDGCPSPACTSLSLVDATSAGCLDIVLHLSRSTADGNYGQAQALKAAISMGRRDIALAIVMGNNPPQAPGLDEAFRVLYNHPNLGPNAKLDIAELLLCAGAGGDIVADALKRSCESQFLEMANMLVKYGASIEHERAAALKSAISRDQNDIVNLLLIGDMKLSPSLASECVGCIPKQTPFENRQFLLASLLRRGAGGNPLSECLVDSAHAGDVVSVDLLVKPLHVLDRKTTGSTDSKKAFDFRDSQRHEVASPDFKDGEALRTAVLRRDMGMTRKILSAQPSPDTLSRAFPLTKNLASAERYQMVELFLKGALTGPSLHDALQDAINEDASHRDDALIKLLLSYDADINFDQGRGLQKVVMQRDVGLLSALIQKASPETAAARVSDVMRVTDHKARYDMMNILTRAGASIGTTEMAEALFGSLQEKPVDMSLLRLLLQQGGADVNALDGAILKQAVNNPDPKVLDLVLSNGKLLNGATTLCLTELAPLPSTEGKCWKLKIILAKSTGKEDIDSLLVHEVQALVRHGAENSSYSTLAYLLESGADPNAFKASALCQAVVAASNTICDMILQSRTTPTPSSLDLALPHALRISDAMDRLSFTKKLVQAGATPQEVNRALTHSITAHASDLSLLGVLARAADTTDGEALCLAASRESAEVVKLLLTSSKHTIKIRDAALVSAVEIKSRGVRFSTCRLLLTNGVSSAVASNALLTAAREDDLDLCDALLAHGASVPDTNGRAVIEACRGGSVGILEVLLKSGVEPQKRILEQGFQAATEIRDLNKRAVIFQSLLKRGVSGEVVDAQLQSAARYGEPGEAILRILLVAGADPNYNNGDAVVAATRSAFIGSLELLIGLWDEGEHQVRNHLLAYNMEANTFMQKKPSHPTLLGAFKASWKLSRDIRFRVMDGLFKAGLPATDDLHIALDDAVNEEDPEERLVKLLLSHGASPSANGCKTLIDATRNAAPSSLALLLSTELPEESLSTAFCSGFVVDNFASWFTERGLETANLLLKRGVRGIALTEALLLVIRNSPAEQVELADRFVDLFLTHAPDVDYNNGVLLQGAASRANVGWTRRLLACHPSGETLSSGLQGILETSLPQEEAFELFKLFTEYREGDVHIDVMAIQTGSDPVLVRAMTLYPRSKDILQALLDAGYWYDQATQCSLHPDMEPEEVTLLTWAIAQPQKRISTSLIQLLLDRGGESSTLVCCPQRANMPCSQGQRPDAKIRLYAPHSCGANPSHGRRTGAARGRG